MALDLTPMYSNFQAVNIIKPVLAVAFTLVLIFTAKLFIEALIDMIRGDSSSKTSSSIDPCEKAFQKRYDKESEKRAYLDWKKNKGY